MGKQQTEMRMRHWVAASTETHLLLRLRVLSHALEMAANAEDILEAKRALALAEAAMEAMRASIARTADLWSEEEREVGHA